MLCQVVKLFTVSMPDPWMYPPPVVYTGWARSGLCLTNPRLTKLHPIHVQIRTMAACRMLFITFQVHLSIQKVKAEDGTVRNLI